MASDSGVAVSFELVDRVGNPGACACGRGRAPFVDLGGELGIRYLCSLCLIDTFSLVGVAPLAEYERVAGESNARVAELQSRVGVLEDELREAHAMREKLELLSAAAEAHDSEVFALTNRISEERERREAAEQLAAGNVNVRALRQAIVQAVDSAWSERRELEPVA